MVDRRGQLGRDRGELTGDPEHLGELANLADVRREREHARLLEGIGDRLWPGRRIAVQIASDPGAEPKGRRRSRHEPSVVGEQELCHAQQALLEEPQPMTDLVEDARSVRAHLVRLPEERDLLRERRLDPPPARGRESCVVELGEEPAQPQVSGKHGAPSRLGRVRGEHELERQLSSGLPERLRLHAGPLEAAERLGQRFSRHASLVLVLPSAPESMVLLGEVHELEVDGERTQDERLPLQLETGHRRPQAFTLRCPTGCPRGPRELADALLLVE